VPLCFPSHYATRGSDCAVAGCTTQLHNRDQRSRAASSFGTILQLAVSILELSHVVQPLDLVKVVSTISVLRQGNLPQIGHLQNPTTFEAGFKRLKFLPTLGCSLLTPTSDLWSTRFLTPLCPSNYPSRLFDESPPAMR
jgi:hypothetical protein